ncbi:MAG: class I SAM-dependent methyltransferase [Nocardioides sp.]|jgi:ubiquinone/menaquinone biosynthesis C-methylase UbiE
MTDTIRAHYDAIASGYDGRTATDWTSNDHLIHVLRDQAVSADNVLDLGGGTGQTTRAVRTVLPDAKVTLVELSPGMAQVARDAFAREEGVRIEVADLDAWLSSTEETYDLIVSAGVLEMAPDLTATLTRIAERVAPGGRVVLTCETRIHGYAPQQAADEVITPPSGPIRVHRPEPYDFEATLRREGLHIDVSRLFVAFHRDHSEPVIYHLVSAVSSD